MTIFTCSHSFVPTTDRLRHERRLGFRHGWVSPWATGEGRADHPRSPSGRSTISPQQRKHLRARLLHTHAAELHLVFSVCSAGQRQIAQQAAPSSSCRPGQYGAPASSLLRQWVWVQFSTYCLSDAGQSAQTGCTQKKTRVDTC